MEHKTQHYLQPTNFSCGQTALATLLSHYGVHFEPEELIAQLPVIKDEQGRAFGTTMQQLATWCLGQGFRVTIYSCDFQVLDLAWSKLSSEDILGRLSAVKETRNVPSLGKHLTETYVDAYTEFLRAGGELRISPWLDAHTLYEIVRNGPISFAVASNVFYERGRSINTGLRTGVPNDLEGVLGTHSVVINGFDSSGDFLISDPWVPDPKFVTRDKLLAAFSSAAYLCDNLFFQIRPDAG